MARIKPLDEAQTRQLLLQLLTEAVAAHESYVDDELGGAPDTQSARWYAERLTTALAEHGYVIGATKPGIAENFDLSGDVAGWDDWL